jgi:hypothetical protein
MSKTSYRILTLVEALGLAAYIGWYIWDLQATKPNSWLVFLVWLTASIVLHRDTPKTLGWRGDNFAAATRQGMPVFVVFVAFALVVAVWFGAYRNFPPHLIQMRHALNYAAFCLLQQVALNSYLTNRLLFAFDEAKLPAAFIAAAVFAALHWPNPVLVPLTFIGGGVMSWLFARERNIIPLAVGQAVVGTLVWWAFPIVWHHGMRVGPGYYTFHR